MTCSRYAWVPYSEGYPFQCANDEVFLHEWLHQVDWALEHVMRVDDMYDDYYPACGEADPDPRRWFPNADLCTSDPDWIGCGRTNCPSTARWLAHMMQAHYDPHREYLGNHCRDGRRDYGETSVDSGGRCR
jgi:hypothetical protein